MRVHMIDVANVVCGAQAQASARLEALPESSNVTHTTGSTSTTQQPQPSAEHVAMQEQYACQVADMEQILAERDACGVWMLLQCGVGCTQEVVPFCALLAAPYCY